MRSEGTKSAALEGMSDVRVQTKQMKNEIKPAGWGL
jgi:hypothetical protein